VKKIVRRRLLRRLLRPVLVTSVGIAFAGGAVWSVAGILAMGSSLASGSSYMLPKPQFLSGSSYMLPKPQFLSDGSLLMRLPDGDGAAAKSARLRVSAGPPAVAASLSSGERKSAPAVDAAKKHTARFDAVERQAALTSEKLADLFGQPKSGKSDRRAAKSGVPAPERFATPDQSQILLAYADPSPTGAGAALSALLAPPEGDLGGSDDLGDDAAGLPGFEDTPDDGPVLQHRPRRLDQPRKPLSEVQPPELRPVQPAAVPRQVEPRKADEREKPKPQRSAYARPNNPVDSGAGIGQSLRSLFGGGPKAGNGVAVYDISAAKVYMPDGSVLEAHSGIGKMADNPRYTNVRMNGPTPPHTYNLKLRERRFHGVEAIRMLPVDGKNKHGRDGFLAHSYLLRGNRAESHGCVAFKDYNRFLTAFKRGKVRQLVVVPSGGRSGVRLASNG